jgi:hypothetical protein
VYRALQLAERAGSGAIGGYAVFAAIAGDGTVHRAETQRGGSSTLFIAGERTGVEPPDAIANAPYAAVMSSGPDRPAPLAQFLPGDGGIGLVTGHRLPNGAGPNGVALNTTVLARMGEGLSAEAALARVLDAVPDADAGMIALGPGRGIAILNSARVARRPDLGSAILASPDGATIAILHNAIWPARTLAPLLADVGLEAMVPARVPLGSIDVCAGIPVIASEHDRVIVDGGGVAVRIETTDGRIVRGRQNCAAVYLGSAVVRGDEVLGTTMEEPNVVVENGVVIILSGQPRFTIRYGHGSGS